MGLEREDYFKRLKKMQGVDAILADVADLIDAHGLKLEEVRDVIEHHLLGEQTASAGRRIRDVRLSLAAHAPATDSFLRGSTE